MSDRASLPWIALVGMMGAGKSTVGQALARRLGLSFVDLDIEIEQVAGRSIPEIFEQQGLAAFRGVECQALTRVLARRPAGVLATGGGVLTHERSAQALKKGAYTVYLEVELSELLERLSSPQARAARPLLPERQDALRDRLDALFRERRSSYQASDLRVDAAASISKVVERIASSLKEGSGSKESS